MYSTANIGADTERNVAGGIAPQGGIVFTTADSLDAGNSPHDITFNTNGDVVDSWYMTFGFSIGTAESETSSVYTGATLDGSGPVAPEINAFTGTHSYVQAGPGQYYCRLYYKYGGDYKYIDHGFYINP